MRINTSRRKRYDFFDNIKKKIANSSDHIIDILARPLDAIDKWMDRDFEDGYYKGYLEGYEHCIDNLCKVTVSVTFDMIKDKYAVIRDAGEQIKDITEDERVLSLVQNIIDQTYWKGIDEKVGDEK